MTVSHFRSPVLVLHQRSSLSAAAGLRPLCPSRLPCPMRDDERCLCSSVPQSAEHRRSIAAVQTICPSSRIVIVHWKQYLILPPIGTTIQRKQRLALLPVPAVVQRPQQ